MKVKDFLSKYYCMTLLIKNMEGEVKEYNRLANSIPGCSFDEIKVDKTKNKEAPYVKWVLKAIEKEQQTVELKKLLPIVKCEIISVIDELEDSQQKRVLIYRYIDWLSWREIATKMYCSIATIRRWHDKAIRQIKIPEKINDSKE